MPALPSPLRDGSDLVHAGNVSGLGGAKRYEGNLTDMKKLSARIQKSLEDLKE